jgi:hypothetical protein
MGISYLEVAVENHEAVDDEAAGSAEAGETLGDRACGSDKSAAPLSRSSIPKGNFGCGGFYPDNTDTFERVHTVPKECL